MKPIIPLVSAIALVLASATALAQNGYGGGQGGQQGGAQQQQQQQQQQQRRQAERSMTQEGTMDRDRLQTRDRDRTQDKDKDKTQAQAHAAASNGKGIYGGNLMTADERAQYRKQFGALTTDQQRNEFMETHRIRMQARAKERGVEPQTINE